MRIVSLCPSNTELIAYLKCEHLLVAIDDYSDWPQSIQSLPRLGPDLSINMDAVEAAKPDLVLASLSVPGMERNIEELKKRKLPYVVYNPNSLEDIRQNLQDLGQRLSIETKAAELLERYDQFLSTYKGTARQIDEKATVYWEWWPKPVFTPGKANWLTEISELAGGENIFADHKEANIQSDWEEVLKRNPYHVCLAWVGVQTNKVNPTILHKRPNWSDMPAIKEHRVYVLEEWLYCRPSPRLLLGLKKLAPLLHPDMFPAFDGKDPLL